MIHEKDLCESPKFCNDSPVEHADDCPVTLMKESMCSSAGVLLDRALALDFAADKFNVNFDDVPADEYNLLRILKAEQNRRDREELEKSKRNGQPTHADRHRG